MSLFSDEDDLNDKFHHLADDLSDAWQNEDHWAMRVSTWVYVVPVLVVVFVAICFCCRRRRRNGQVLAPPPAAVPPPPGPAAYPRQQYAPAQAYPVVTAYPIVQAHNQSFPAPYPAQVQPPYPAQAPYPAQGQPPYPAQAPYPAQGPSAPDQNALPPTYDQAVGSEPYEKHLPYNPNAPR